MPNEDVSRKQQRKAAVDKVQEGDMESGPSVTFYCPFLNIERCQSEEMLFVIYSILILGLVFLCSLAMTAWPQHNIILMPVSNIFVLVPIGVLTEYRACSKTTIADVEDQSFFRFDDVINSITSF